jgi:hypothetical protein
VDAVVAEPRSAAEGALLDEANIHQAVLDLRCALVLKLCSAVLLGAISTPLVHKRIRTTANKHGETRRKIYCFAGIFEHRRTSLASSLCIDAEEVSSSNPLSPTLRKWPFCRRNVIYRPKLRDRPWGFVQQPKGAANVDANFYCGLQEVILKRYFSPRCSRLAL